MPSRTTNGVFPLIEFKPRIYIVMASSAGAFVCWIAEKPANRPINVAEKPLLGVFTSSSP